MGGDIGSGSIAPNALIGDSSAIIETPAGVNKWLWLNMTNDSTFPGTLQNGSGSIARGLGLNKRGPGALTLNGTVTFNDTLTLQYGTVNLVGAGVWRSNGTQVDIVGNVNDTSGVLNISGGATYIENDNTGQPYNSTLTIGGAARAAGDVRVGPGCTVFINRQLTVGASGNGGGYGGFNQTGGNTTIGGFIALGGTTNGGAFNQSGGTVSLVGPSTGIGATLGYSTTAAHAVMNLSGTAVFNVGGANNGIWPGEVGTGVLNVSGNAVVTITNGGLILGKGNAAGNGTVNLLGGLTTVNSISQGTGSGTFNFNGGTLMANLPNPTFIAGLTAVYVYSGGAIIDDGGNAITISQTISAPTAYGVLSIPVNSGGSNYVDTPVVTITNIISGGSGATAVANVSAGAITSLTITCPGINYNPGDVLGVSLAGGGGTGASFGTATFALNTAGGLTKQGSGTLTLDSAGNGFAGTTKVLAGTLQVAAGAFITSADLLVSNSTFSVDVSSSPSFSVGNLTLQGNPTLAISYGNLSANPSSPAINGGGNLTVSGANVALSISGLGLQPGQFTVIKYTGTALPNLNNFSLLLPPGVVATLVNNTGNDSIDLNVSSAPRSLTWYGANGSTWDVNTTVNWKDLGVDATYLQYTNGAVIVGDAVTFDDTLTNDFVNPQPTNINLTAGIYSFPITVNSTLPYSFGGAGTLAGTGFLVKSNAGTLTIATSNSYSGGTFLYEGMVFVTNDFNLGGSSGALTFAGGTLQTTSITNTRRGFVTAASTLDVLPGSTAQFGGILSGSGTLTKIDSGTLNLTGTMSNTPLVSAGTFNVPAPGRITTTGVIDIGNGNASNAVLTISGGTVQGNNAAGQFNSGIIAGSALNSAGDIQMTSGSLNTFQQFGLGGGQGGYGALTMSGGTATFGSYLVVGFNNDNAVLNQSGGAITVTTNCLTVAAGGPLSVGLANFSGGTFVATDSTNGNASGRGGAFVGENGSGVVNVSGTAALTLIGDANVIIGRQSGSSGILNLRGGIVTTPQVSRGAGSAALSFNGGALKASAPAGAFINGLNSATLYGGGAVIDDGGFAITVSQPLQAPTGFGVASIPVSVGGSGYIDIPIVTLSGGTGSNATAVATVSGGAVTGITITSPGSGYSSGDILSTTLTGGGSTGATLGTPVLAANTGGGLLKRGAGTLTLTGADTYTGTTIVSNGTLIVTPAHQTPGSVVVSNSATFGVLANTSASAVVGNLQLGSSSSGTNFLAFILNSGSNPTVAPLQAGTITVTGTNNVRLAGQILTGTFPLVKYTGALGGTGVINSNVLAPQGVVATVSNDVADSILFVNVSSAISGLTWTGTNNAPALTNVWGLNAATNWLAGSTPVVYTELLPPGDPVVFNDSGSGTVLLSNTVSPANVLFSNSLVNYSMSGTGHVAGVTGLTKQGSGNVLLNLSGNTYAGDTTVNAGTLQLGSATALPSGAGVGNLFVNANGVVDLNNNSQTINGLNGSGLINNSGGTAVTLTVGSANAPGTWNGTINNSGAGSISLTKVGTNNLVLSGTNDLGSGTASQMNGGLTIITNGALVAMSTGEFWVQQNAGTATVIVDGGTLVTSNNWLVVGRNNTGANGTLIVNHGLVQKAGANNIVVGSLAATGLLVVNGGQVLNNNNLWLGENTGAHGTLQLNGGLIQANQIRANGSAPTASQAFFNGGILQCTGSNTNFIQSPVQVVIQAGGMVFDDAGFVETNLTQPWQDDGTAGAVTKTGSGTLYLDSINTYAGITHVTNGTLAGIGSIIGPVQVVGTGNIGAGDGGTNIGTLTINNSLTLQGNTTFRITKTGGVLTNDSIAGLTSASFGGTLTLNNITSDATPLAIGDSFQLFAGTGFAGAFAAIVPATPGNGLAWNTSALASTGVISIVAGAVNPIITSISPASPVGSSYPQTLSIVGSTFQSGCSVLVSNVDTATGSTLAATFTDSAHISVTPIFGTATHNWQAIVINPGGGGSSAPFSFVVTTAPRPGISSIKVAAGQVVLSGNNGTQGLQYSVLSSTNVTVHLVNWTSLATNTFGPGGSFSWTNAIDPSQPHVFYIIKP
jgi:autotransporter-associated beta strand protein